MGSKATGTQDAVSRYGGRAVGLDVGCRGYKFFRILAYISVLSFKVNARNYLHGEDTLLGWAC